MTDEKLILQLFKLNSEKAVRRFLVSYLDKIDVPFERDKMGNVYYINHEGLPLLSAHMDFIKFNSNPIVQVYENYILGEGMGGDDKAGILIILKILETTEVNFLFTVKEEIGAQGARYFVRHNELEVPYCLVLDRKGGHDILCSQNNYGTKKFERTLAGIGKAYGFRPNRGTFCDANILNRQVSCANIGVGYYDAHRPRDYVDLTENHNTYEFVRKVVTTLKRKFEPPKEKFDYFQYYTRLTEARRPRRMPEDERDYLEELEMIINEEESEQEEFEEQEFMSRHSE